MGFVKGTVDGREGFRGRELEVALEVRRPLFTLFELEDEIGRRENVANPLCKRGRSLGRVVEGEAAITQSFA